MKIFSIHEESWLTFSVSIFFLCLVSQKRTDRRRRLFGCMQQKILEGEEWLMVACLVSTTKTLKRRRRTLPPSPPPSPHQPRLKSWCPPLEKSTVFPFIPSLGSHVCVRPSRKIFVYKCQCAQSVLFPINCHVSSLKVQYCCGRDQT